MADVLIRGEMWSWGERHVNMKTVVIKPQDAKAGPQGGDRHGADTPSQPSGARKPASAQLVSYWHPEPRDNPLLSSDCWSSLRRP